MKFGELFAGIGGMSLGLERAGLEAAWAVERDPYCRRVLTRHYPHVPLYEDVTTTDWTRLPMVDLLAGGFPCQDISAAGNRHAGAGLRGGKSGLWRNFRDAVEAIAPKWVLVENVAAWRRWVPEVRSDLSQLGYASLPVGLYAGTFGAPHRRARIFVVAHADGEGEPVGAIHAQASRLRPAARPDGDWGSPPPGGWRVDDGSPHGMDRTRVIGNAVVPAVAQWLGEQIMEQG